MAAAATVNSSWSSTISDNNNNTYHGKTSATSSGSQVRSTATTVTTDGTKVEIGYACAKAELHRGSALVAETDRRYNTTVATGVTATTLTVAGSGNYTGRGETGCWNGSSYVTVSLPSTPILQIGSRATNSVMQYTDLSFEDRAIGINAFGETYGTALASALSGQKYDLISAVGIHGIQGYIRSEDRPQLASSPDMALIQVSQNRYIPVYEADGKTVIDQFLIGSGDET